MRDMLVRRALVVLAPALLCRPEPSFSAATAFDELCARLEAPQLQEPAVAPSGARPPALPAWIAGAWRCRQTLRAFATPQGVQFLGAAGRPISEAEASAAETRSKIGSTVELDLRYLSGDDGGSAFEVGISTSSFSHPIPAPAHPSHPLVQPRPPLTPPSQDRPFNTRSRLDAFAGRRVVSSCALCAEAGQAVACVTVEFRGPASQKTITNSARLGVGSGGQTPAFALSELSRAVFSRRLQPGDTRNFPPILTDQETILLLQPSADGATATGRLRLVSYLQPLDQLYFAAGKRAVAISDYALELQRLA